jgi:hypothetical protein
VIARPALTPGIGFPHASLAIQLTRRRSRGGKQCTETVYAVTDLDWGEIRADGLAAR